MQKRLFVSAVMVLMALTSTGCTAMKGAAFVDAPQLLPVPTSTPAPQPQQLDSPSPVAGSDDAEQAASNVELNATNSSAAEDAQRANERAIAASKQKAADASRKANLAAAKLAKAQAAAVEKARADAIADAKAAKLADARERWDKYNSAYQAEYKRQRAIMANRLASRGLSGEGAYEFNMAQIPRLMAEAGWPPPGERP